MKFALRVIRPRSVLYDWDGTLIRFRSEAFLHSINAALNNFDLPGLNSLSESKNIRDTLAKTGNLVLALEIFRHNFTEYPISRTDLIPDALEILEHTHSLGLKQGVVSNLDHKLLVPEIRRLGLDKYFAIVIGSKNQEQLKPKPDLLFTAMQAVNLQPRTTFYLGDNNNDMLAARAAGCISVYIGMDPIKEKPDIALPRIKEFQHILSPQPTRSVSYEII